MKPQYNITDRQRAAVKRIFATFDETFSDEPGRFAPVDGIIAIQDGEILDTRDGSPFRFETMHGINRLFSEDRYDNIETFAAQVVFMRGPSSLGIERCWLPSADGEIRYIGSAPSESIITNL